MNKYFDDDLFYVCLNYINEALDFVCSLLNVGNAEETLKRPHYRIIPQGLHRRRVVLLCSVQKS